MTTEIPKGQRSYLGSVGKARSLDCAEEDVGTPCVGGVCVCVCVCVCVGGVCVCVCVIAFIPGP